MKDLSETIINSSVIAVLSDISHDKLLGGIVCALPELISLGESDQNVCVRVDTVNVTTGKEETSYLLDYNTATIILAGFSLALSRSFQASWSSIASKPDVVKSFGELAIAAFRELRMDSMEISEAIGVEHDALVINLVRVIKIVESDGSVLVRDYLGKYTFDTNVVDGKTHYVLPHSLACKLIEECYADKFDLFADEIHSLILRCSQDTQDALAEACKDSDMMLSLIINLTTQECEEILGLQPQDLFSPFQARCFEIMSNILIHYRIMGSNRDEIYLVLSKWHDDAIGSAVACLSVDGVSPVTAPIH